MRLTTRFIALGLAGVLLVACSHKDKNAPLAFAPADTPYVLANLDVLDAATRSSLLAQADAQLPAQMAQMDAAADKLATSDPEGARLMHVLVAEFKGKNVEAVVRDIGLKLDGYYAIYGIGMTPVARFELTDAKAFDGFIARVETAYGSKLDTAHEGEQSYRRHVFASSGAQLVMATQGKHGVIALLPANATTPLLRQALGLDRPQKNLQEDGRLATLAKANGYQKWAVGQLDLARALPLALGGTDPLLNAARDARAKAVSVQTGEPVAAQVQTSASCTAEAARIAARVPSIAFGYTRVDAKHQDARMDIALAADIGKAFSGVKVALPGLGGPGPSGTAPFDFAVALPIAQLSTFWSAQAEAVAAKPFTCSHFVGLNDGFAKLAANVKNAAKPPYNDLLGLRVVLDNLITYAGNASPRFSGRIVLGTNKPAELFAMGQALLPGLSELELPTDGRPAKLPPNLGSIIGPHSWLAMGPKALVLGIGTELDSNLARNAIQAPGGDAGRMARMHLTGDIYAQWLQLMEQKVDSLAAAAAAMTRNDDGDADTVGDPDIATTASDVARSKAQFAAMKAQAERIASIDVEMHVQDKGIVITTQTTLK